MFRHIYDPPYNHWYGTKTWGLFRFKVTYGGSLATANDLPERVFLPGLMFNIREDGSNYIWNGIAWDKLDSNLYVGATNQANGIQGLVPPATSEERNKFLRGDAVWADAGVPTGTLTCAYVGVKKTFYSGISISDGDGDWLRNTVEVTANLSATESRLYTINLRFGADGPGGCALWYPYNSTHPITTENRNYEYYKDSWVFARSNTNHYIQTFSDGFTMDAWIEVDATQAGYHNLKVMVYGPKAVNVPRLVCLNVDGTVQTSIQNLTAGESVDITVSGTSIKLYPRPTHNTTIYWGESPLPEAVELTSTPYESPYLSYTAVKTDTGIRITAKDYTLNDWPTELSSVYLTLRSGDTTSIIDMNCLPYWVSTQLTKIDEDIADVNTRVSAIGIYQGATSEESGTSGLVPSASASEKDYVLKGDGTWLSLADIESRLSNLESRVTTLES